MPRLYPWTRALAGVCLALPLAGCYLPLATSWSESTDAFELSAENCDRLAVYTHNGAIRVGAAAPGSTTIAVRAKIRVGAASAAEAEAALANVEIETPLVEPNDGAGGRLQEVRWRWRQPPHPNWRIEVSFDVALPAEMGVHLETHNGEISTVGLASSDELVTHNGKITVRRHQGPSLLAQTHNGELRLETAAQTVDLSSHNGELSIQLAAKGPLAGKLQTHNGEVVLGFGPLVETELRCQTVNGRVRPEIQLENLETRQEKRRLSGRLGSGGGQLTVETHNGSIRLMPAPADESGIEPDDGEPAE